MIDKYGADALRMTLMTGNAPGNDMRFYWGAGWRPAGTSPIRCGTPAGLSLMNLEKAEGKAASEADLTLADRWILSRVNTLAKEVTENMDKYELGDRPAEGL